MEDTHKILDKQTDNITRAEYGKCIQCDQVYIYGDPWQNTYCPNGQLTELRNRLRGK